LFSNVSQAGAVKITLIEKWTEITREDTFSYFADYYKKDIPESYMYIDLNFIDVKETDSLYRDLQVLVYLDLIKNSAIKIHSGKKVDLYTLSKLSENILWVKATDKRNIDFLKKKIATTSDLDSIKRVLKEQENSIELRKNISDTWEQIEIFQDVYKTLREVHYDRDDLDQKKLIYSAIEWLTKGVGDKHTIYFPPVKSKDFKEEINGEYEWIGSYVDMLEPGNLTIISPIVGSPSQKAWLKGGDRITHVDGKEITPDINLHEAISWIKWPKGTSVTLTVLRKEKILEIEVTREKIIIKNIEHKILKNGAFYIQVKNFGPKVFKEFSVVMDELQNQRNIKKVIIDVRDNPGGYLNEVSKMLGFFVPKGQATAIINYGENDDSYTSAGFDTVDFSKYKIVLLQNSGTASASEILVWTIKDYYPKSIIMWEKSYGKGSVQNIKWYSDGSTLKVTVAKWFTGKTRTGIDGIGITPDIEVELDEEKYKKGTDTQLERALKN